jgi:hypothetical protein
LSRLPDAKKLRKGGNIKFAKPGRAGPSEELDQLQASGGQVRADLRASTFARMLRPALDAPALHLVMGHLDDDDFAHPRDSRLPADFGWESEYLVAVGQAHIAGAVDSRPDDVTRKCDTASGGVALRPTSG